MDKSPSRKATRKADHAALDTLAKRGITKDERQRMQGLISVAQALASAEPTLDSTVEARQKDLMARRVWYDDWSETAKAAISRRDHLIRVGLAKRKKKAKATAPEGGEKGA